MRTKINSVLALFFLFFMLSLTSVKAQTYCDQTLRFCMATSYSSGDMQTSDTGFYTSVPSVIYYSASIEPYGSNHYGFVWILYGDGDYILESNNEGFKSDNGQFSSPGYQTIEIFAEARDAKSYVSVGW